MFERSSREDFFNVLEFFFQITVLFFALEFNPLFYKSPFFGLWKNWCTGNELVLFYVLFRNNVTTNNLDSVFCVFKPELLKH